MKLAEKEVEVQSNMQFDESVEMGIGHDAIPMVIERLISTYNHPERSCLQEYSSNAWDVHVQWGVKRPVEVSLPSPLTPSLRIRDYGVGLSRAELKGFGQFGQSTKRDTNELTGGFGLGSKSGLAAASQFIVMSIKNGKRNTVVVARDEDNRPHMNFLPEADTDEDSGTLITIPISDKSRLGNIDEFFIGWKPGTILIDEEEPKRSIHNPNQFRPLANGVGWKDLSLASPPQYMIRVVINQVSYMLDYRKIGLEHREQQNLRYYVLNVPNGSVKIAPSREDLIYDTPTRTVLQERARAVLTHARADYVDALDAAATMKLAFQARDNMRNAGYPTDDLRWKGRPMLLPGDKFKGNTLPDPEGTWCNPQKNHTTKTGWLVEKSFGRLGRQSIWNWSERSKFVVVHSAEAPTYVGNGRRTRQAHKEYASVGDWLTSVTDSKDYSWTIFVTSEPINRLNYWYRGMADAILSADEFNAAAKVKRDERVKRERAAQDTPSKKVELKVLTGSYYGSPDVLKMSVKDIKADYKRVVILRNGDKDWVLSAIRSSLTTKRNYSSQYSDTALWLARAAEAAIILVNKNDDLSAVMPLLPKETTFAKIAAKQIKKTIGDTTKYQKMALRDRTNREVYAIQNLPLSTIEDIKNEATRSWAHALKTYKDSGKTIREKLEWMSSSYAEVKAALKAATPKGADTIPDSPLDRFPLVESFGSYYNQPKARHLIDYINTMDAVLDKSATS